MPTTRQEFSESTLTDLARALSARTSAQPDNPELIASWPGVHEEHMAAACAELLRRGHPVFVAQHATATCCRNCLARNHGIAKGHELTAEELEYVVGVICRWIERELGADPEAQLRLA